MGIVKISEQMHENLRVASGALCRSINAQAEHWMRVGMLAELYPELTHHDISRMLVRAERAGGLDMASLLGSDTDSSQPEPIAAAGGQS
ncbi:MULTISPECIES: ParD-like family protein [Marinobacter]|uniref:ParD-like family protein n=1 Tax=Marinobacter TaxID=2742 RepID=UPI000DACAA0C|nr:MULTISPECIES: ParD-like family protein [Marinobacter]